MNSSKDSASISFVSTLASFKPTGRIQSVSAIVVIRHLADALSVARPHQRRCTPAALRDWYGTLICRVWKDAKERLIRKHESFSIEWVYPWTNARIQEYLAQHNTKSSYGSAQSLAGADRGKRLCSFFDLLYIWKT